MLELVVVFSSVVVFDDVAFDDVDALELFDVLLAVGLETLPETGGGT